DFLHMVLAANYANDTNGAMTWRRGSCRSRNSRLVFYFCFGGYFSRDFLTMSSSLPSTLVASLFSSRAIPRQTRDRVPVSRKSMTRLPSVYGILTTRVPSPRQPAGYLSTSVLRADPSLN